MTRPFVAIQEEDIAWTGGGDGGIERIRVECMDKPQCPIEYRDVLRHKLDSSFKLLETPISGSTALFNDPRHIALARMRRAIQTPEFN